jgi:ABC-type Fe3+/spermidine/putrescine transport system ATPase subunit
MKDGVIVQQGAPREIYHSPATEFVASFIGSTNLVPGEVTGRGRDGTVRVQTPFGSVDCDSADDWQPGRQVVIAVRPEEIEIHRRSADTHGTLDSGNVIHGTVEIGLFTGTFVDYHVDCEGRQLQARSGSRRPIDAGEDVQLVLPPHACRVFARESADADDRGGDDRRPTAMGDLMSATDAVIAKTDATS